MSNGSGDHNKRTSTYIRGYQYAWIQLKNSVNFTGLVRDLLDEEMEARGVDIRALRDAVDTIEESEEYSDLDEALEEATTVRGLIRIADEIESDDVNEL